MPGNLPNEPELAGFDLELSRTLVFRDVVEHEQRRIRAPALTNDERLNRDAAGDPWTPGWPPFERRDGFTFLQHEEDQAADDLGNFRKIEACVFTRFLQ